MFTPNGSIIVDEANGTMIVGSFKENGLVTEVMPYPGPLALLDVIDDMRADGARVTVTVVPSWVDDTATLEK